LDVPLAEPHDVPSDPFLAPASFHVKVTIITVAYNSAQTIADTLASVSAQTYRNIEHIVIDGCSTDATMDIVGRHAHVALSLSEPDKGIYDAMNKGISLATGDLIGFLNADDVLNGADAVSSLVREVGPSTDVVYADLDYVRSDDLSRVVRHWHSGHFRRSRLRFGWMPPHPTFYVRRPLLKEVGGFDTGLRIAADYEFMMRCLSRPSVKITYVRRVLVCMRTGGVSNASLPGMLRKSREDLLAMRRHGVGGWLTLVAKNLRKLPQFIRSSTA
jgi:glycosyltransferase